MAAGCCRDCGLYSPASADPFVVQELFTAPFARYAHASLSDLIAQETKSETPVSLRPLFFWTLLHITVTCQICTWPVSETRFGSKAREALRSDLCLRDYL